MNLQLSFTPEQQSIIDASTRRSNIVVDAVAGAGKTFTIIGIALANPDKTVIVLTYNRNLCNETYERFSKLGLTNVEIYTYHSYARRFYTGAGFDDSIIENTIQQNLPPLEIHPTDIIICDEFQDVNPRLFKLILKIMKDLVAWSKCLKFSLVVLGDRRQCVYQSLTKSDSRYLIFAESLFAFLGAFERFSINTSYRLTAPLARFMNAAVLKSTLYRTVKPGGRKPTVVTANLWTSSCFNYLLSCIKERNYAAEDIFILCPSLKTDGTPLGRLVNFLSRNGFPVHYGANLESATSAEELANKIAVSTYHSSKGRERALVIIFSFDASYFRFYARDSLPENCTNQQYVAYTRATNDLILVRAHNQDDLPFLDRSMLQETCDHTVLDSPTSGRRQRVKAAEILSVTSLLEYTTFDTFLYVKKLYASEQLAPLGNCGNSGKSDLRLVTKVERVMEGKVITENVANLNGIAVTLIYEYHLKGSLTCVTELQRKAVSGDHWKGKRLQKQILALKANDMIFPQDFIFVALLLESEGLLGCEHRLKQVLVRNWLTEADRQKIIARLSLVCGSEAAAPDFEVPFVDKDLVLGRKLTARVDIIDNVNKQILEIKCVERITDAHKIQVLLYWYLAVKQDEKFRDYTPIVVNVRDGSRVKVVPGSDADILYVLEYLLEKKFTPPPKIPDDEFLRDTERTVAEYFSVSDLRQTA